MSVIVSWKVARGTPENPEFQKCEGKVLQFLMKDGAPMVAVLVLGDKPTIVVRDLTTVRYELEIP